MSCVLCCCKWGLSLHFTKHPLLHILGFRLDQMTVGVLCCKLWVGYISSFCPTTSRLLLYCVVSVLAYWSLPDMLLYLFAFSILRQHLHSIPLHAGVVLNSVYLCSSPITRCIMTLCHWPTLSCSAVPLICFPFTGSVPISLPSLCCWSLLIFSSFPWPRSNTGRRERRRVRQECQILLFAEWTFSSYHFFIPVFPFAACVV